MSVTKDKVQIEIEFITDASKNFARTIQETEKYRNELRKAQKEVTDLAKEEERLAAKGKDTTQVALKRAEAQQKVSDTLSKIAATGKQVEGIDLSKLMPSQLNQRATQLKQALQFIPESHPARAQMKADFDAISDKLRELNGRGKAVEGTLNEMRVSGGRFQSVLTNAFSMFLGGGVLDAVQNVFSSVFGYLKGAVTSYGEAARADAQLRASLKSTGEVGGKSFEDLTEAAESLSKVTLFDDDQIKGAESILLTFTNIRGEVYDNAIPAILDISQALGQDLKSSSVQVGKALNDPIQGITALSRVGVSFSDAQKATITTLVETNRVAEAQALILKELETEFGGSARAAAEAGLGPYQLIQKRFGEIQESIGGLIERGLRPFAPILGNITTFFEKLTDVIISGEKAQGEFSDGVNIAAAVLKGLGNIIYIVYKGVEFAVGLWWEWQKVLISVAGYITDFIKKAEQIPVIGLWIKSITEPLRLLGDLLDNASATWAGFEAAAKQAITNVQVFFQGLAVSAGIAMAELNNALTFDKVAKEQNQAFINQLKSQKSELAATGRDVGKAYSDARIAAIKSANAEAAKEDAADAARRAKSAPLSIGGISADDAKKQQKEFQKQLKEGFDLQIKETELFWERERLANEIAFQTKKRSESDYTEQDYILQIEKYEGLLKIQNTYLGRLKQGTIEYLEAEKAILELEKKRAEAVSAIAPRNTQVTETLTTNRVTNVNQSVTGTTLESLKAQENVANLALQQRFANHTISEIQFENEKARIQQQYAQKRLEDAEKYGETEKGQIAKLYQEKLAADNNYHETLRTNEKRTADLKAELEQVKLGLASQAFSVAIDLLSKDEAARKKNAAAIKAFQIGQITADGISEVQAIWRNANANPINALIPGAGTAIAIAQTALAVGRSIAAIGKISAQKFAKGTFMSKMGFFGGKPHSAGGTKGYFDDGTVIEVEKDEGFAVVNKQDAPLLRTLSAINSRNGVPYFANGAILGMDTTPRLNGFYTPQYNNTKNADIESLKQEFKNYADNVKNWADNLTVNLSLFQLEKAQNQKNIDLKDAQFG